jgi:hypothetical protein
VAERELAAARTTPQLPPGQPRILLFAPRFDRVLRHCSELLERGLEVHFVAEVDQLVELAGDRAFRAVVAFPSLHRSALAPLLARVRKPGGRGMRPCLVLLLRRSHLSRAHDLLERGVSRILADTTPPQVLSDTVVDLLRRAPRADLRLPARLEVRGPEGPVVTMGQTVNLSTSGVLVQAPGAFPLGSTIHVEVSLDGSRKPLCGVARLARHARPDREGLQGFAARFHALEGESRLRLEALIGARLR